MLFTKVYAQSDVQSIGSVTSPIELISLFLLLAFVWYFLIIRPQRQQIKLREEKLNSLRRGDHVLTAGGITGKVTRILDNSELEVEICDGVRIRVIRSYISDIRSKSESI
ncbi:preprotein translocase subunit YajC [Candidatus Liberibacter americanus]|uniref:Sec translocon accessory complex subunit YajC n=1 Tax=Candidatus Liberibacter americanus str. Sao Paulo TaxID=1261131 RepID=U6B5Q9_9HYPH|nr:preprotein translocase subunit YajC [Candidatus Liberibacter americanus]AHA28178.1 Preprotein translocase subunit YajC [Candidatus Liberibacter americanus str. Sao Paulo]EMS35852.1 preprotein translocase subunit YajC [Candidatus Liberibacter americanus PW_SP]